MRFFDIFYFIFLSCCSHYVYANSAFLSVGSINSPCSTQDQKKCRSHSPEVPVIIPKLEDCILPRRNSHYNNLQNIETPNKVIKNQNLSTSFPALSVSALQGEIRSDDPDDIIFERGAHQSASLEEFCFVSENHHLKKKENNEKQKVAQLQWLTLMQKIPEVKSDDPKDFMFARGAHQSTTPEKSLDFIENH